MPTPNTRITSSGTYLVNGNFDEVTGVIISNGLVVYLDAGRTASNASSTATWVDVVGGYVSTLTNVAYSNTGGGSVYFTGNSTQAATLYSLTGTFWSSTTWTVSVWANMSFLQTQKSGTGDNAFLSHGATSPDQGLHLGERAGIVYFGFYADDLSGVTTLTTGTWNNIVWQYNPTTRVKNIYVNGRLDRTGTASGYYTATNANTEIGRYTWSYGQVLYGYMGQVAIYNRTLSPLEILKNYQTFLGRYSNTGTYTRSSVTPGTVYYDQLDEVTYNPNNGVAAINQFSYSQYFTSTNWTPGGAFVILNTSTVQAPDGSLTATKLVDIAGAGAHNLTYNTGFSFSTGSVYNFSIYVKAEEINSIGVYLPGGNSGAKYNVSTGALIANDVGITSSITPYPNGWWRINATYTSVLTAVVSPQLYMMNPGTFYTATGGQGLYIWGAQFELGVSTASIYVATTSSGVKSTAFAQRTDNQGTAYVRNYFDEVSGMINTNGLILNLNAGSLASYPGSGTVWKDLSDRCYNATLQPGVTYVTTASGSLVVNGTNYADVGKNLSNMGIINTGTFSGWVYPLSNGASYVLSDWNLTGMTLRTNDNTSTDFYIYDPSGIQLARITAYYSFTPNNWYNLAGVMTTTTIYLYVNGTQIGTPQNYTGTLGSSGSTLKVGTRGDGAGGPGNYVSNVQVYNRALSATEVLDNFNSTRAQYGV